MATTKVSKGLIKDGAVTIEKLNSALVVTQAEGIINNDNDCYWWGLGYDARKFMVQPCEFILPDWGLYITLWICSLKEKLFSKTHASLFI